MWPALSWISFYCVGRLCAVSSVLPLPMTKPINVGWDFPHLSMAICAFLFHSTHSLLLLAKLHPLAHYPNLHFQPRPVFCIPPQVLWDKAGLIDRALYPWIFSSFWKPPSQRALFTFFQDLCLIPNINSVHLEWKVENFVLFFLANFHMEKLL